MREHIATIFWVIALLLLTGSLVVFVIVLFPLSLVIVGLPVFIVICRTLAYERHTPRD